MQKVVGVKKEFDKDIYYFSINEKVKVGDKVVVIIDEFQTIATVKIVIDKTDKFENLQPIKRMASSQDLSKYQELAKKTKDILPQIKAKSINLGLVMKFIGAQYSLDESKIVIVFSSEERVDFRQFLKDLALMLKTRIELKQIGQRDEVKVCGGVGPCGEQCCCTRFLKDFEHVSVKMAKMQGLSLAPTKINGICGRLMCCLAYESKQYEEICSKMPKVNSEITTPNGIGKVVYNDILRERVSVKRQLDGDSFVIEDFNLEDLKFAHNDKIKKDFKGNKHSNKHHNNKSEQKHENVKHNKNLENKNTQESSSEQNGQKHKFKKNRFKKNKKDKNQ